MPFEELIEIGEQYELPEMPQKLISILHKNEDASEKLDEVLELVCSRKPFEREKQFLLYILEKWDFSAEFKLMTCVQNYARECGGKEDPTDVILREHFYVGTEVTKFVETNFCPPLTQKRVKINLSKFLEIVQRYFK